MADLYEDALVAFRSGDNDLARQLSERALEAARSTHTAAAETDALCMLSRVALRDGEIGLVQKLAEEGRAVARASGEERLERMPLHMQAVAARMNGDHSLAHPL